eukprot:6284941-Prymnesium_polylepis.1
MALSFRATWLSVREKVNTVESSRVARTSGSARRSGTCSDLGASEVIHLGQAALTRPAPHRQAGGTLDGRAWAGHAFHTR